VAITKKCIAVSLGAQSLGMANPIYPIAKLLIYRTSSASSSSSVFQNLAFAVDQ
jgi:hypothetical protein